MSWAGKMFFLANKLDSSFIFCTLTHELHFFHNLVFAVVTPLGKLTTAWEAVGGTVLEVTLWSGILSE